VSLWFNSAFIPSSSPAALGAVGLDHRLQVSEQLVREAPLIEALGLASRRPRRQQLGTLLESLDRLGQAIGRLFLKPNAGRLTRVAERDHRFRGSAPAKGNHRRAAGLRLDRHDAEIFLAGKQQGPAAAQMIADHLVRLPAEEVYAWPSQGTQPGFVLART